MVQNVVYPYGTQDVALTSGQKLSLSSYGEGTVDLKYAIGDSNVFQKLQTFSNKEVIIGGYSEARTIRISATSDRVDYTVGASTTTLGSKVFSTPDDRSVTEYFEDFYYYNPDNFVVTTTEAGAGSASETITTEKNGVLLLTNDNADNDNDFLQPVGNPFQFVSGKELWFEGKFKTNDATESDIIFGLQSRTTTPLNLLWGVYFLKNDGAATLDFVVVNNATATTISEIATLVNNTYITVGYYYDGDSTLEYYINGLLIGTAPTTNLPAVTLTASFGIQNGAAAAKTLAIDYIRVVQER